MTADSPAQGPARAETVHWLRWPSLLLGLALLPQLLMYDFAFGIRAEPIGFGCLVFITAALLASGTIRTRAYRVTAGRVDYIAGEKVEFDVASIRAIEVYWSFIFFYVETNGQLRLFSAKPPLAQLSPVRAPLRLAREAGAVCSINYLGWPSRKIRPFRDMIGKRRSRA